MAHKTGAKGNGRNFGLKGGPGKGSADRTSNRKAFNKNFEGIDWTNHTHPFANTALRLVSRKGNRIIKKYQ